MSNNLLSNEVPGSLCNHSCSSANDTGCPMRGRQGSQSTHSLLLNSLLRCSKAYLHGLYPIKYSWLGLVTMGPGLPMGCKHTRLNDSCLHAQLCWLAQQDVPVPKLNQCCGICRMKQILKPTCVTLELTMSLAMLSRQMLACCDWRALGLLGPKWDCPVCTAASW